MTVPKYPPLLAAFACGACTILAKTDDLMWIFGVLVYAALAYFCQTLTLDRQRLKMLYEELEYLRKLDAIAEDKKP